MQERQLLCSSSMRGPCNQIEDRSKCLPFCIGQRTKKKVIFDAQITLNHFPAFTWVMAPPDSRQEKSLTWCKIHRFGVQQISLTSEYRKWDEAMVPFALRSEIVGIIAHCSDLRRKRWNLILPFKKKPPDRFLRPTVRNSWFGVISAGHNSNKES